MSWRRPPLSRAAALGLFIAAIEPSISDQSLKRAIELGRGDERTLAAFHRRYVVPLPNEEIREIEVVTEFRRAVLAVEERRALAERLPETAELRRLRQIVEPFRNRVSILARARYSPQTALVTVPQYQITIAPGAGGSEIRPLDVRRTPQYVLGSATQLYGTDVEAIFDVAALARIRGRVVVRLPQRDLGAATIDFTSID